MLFLKVLRVIEFLNILLVASIMPSGDTNNSTFGAVTQSNETQLLLNFISSLYRKDTLQKPSTFYLNNGDIKQHLQSVENYLKSIGIKDDLGRITILLETLEQRVRNSIIFEYDYDENSTNYSWLKEKLIKMYAKKTNSTYSMIELLNLKQDGQTLQEFMVEIKSTLALNESIEKQDKSKLALHIFLKGLNDKKVAKAVQLQNPGNIDKAFSLAISVKEKEAAAVNQLKNIDTHNLGCSEEIKQLQKQVAYLTQLVLALKSSQSKDQSNRNINRSYNKPGFRQTTYRKNYDNKVDNPSYNARQPLRNQENSWHRVEYKNSNRRCFRCNGVGHISRFCRQNPIVNQLNVSDNETECNSFVPESYSDENDVHEEKYSVPKILCMKSPRSQQRKPVTYPKDIVLTADFIDGKISKKSYSDALKQNCNALTIHHFNNKKDDNKPLIKGRVCNQQAKIFIDSGAEVNVIDEKLFNSLEIDSNKIMRSKDNGIKCANNTHISILGKVILPISIGIVKKYLSFNIVKDISPHIILGLRGLKTLNTDIFSSKDFVKCKGIEIPFCGKINCD